MTLHMKVLITIQRKVKIVDNKRGLKWIVILEEIDRQILAKTQN